MNDNENLRIVEEKDAVEIGQAKKKSGIQCAQRLDLTDECTFIPIPKKKN